MTGAMARSIAYTVAAVAFLVPALAFGFWPGPAALTDRLALTMLFGVPGVIGGYRAVAGFDRDIQNVTPQSVSSIVSRFAG